MLTPSERYWYLGYRRIKICKGKVCGRTFSVAVCFRRGDGTSVLRDFRLIVACRLLFSVNFQYECLLGT